MQVIHYTQMQAVSVSGSVQSSEYKRGQACNDYKIKTQVGNGQYAFTRKLAKDATG